MRRILLALLIALTIVGCNKKDPNKIATVRIVSPEGKVDTVTVEYVDQLQIFEGDLVDDYCKIQAVYVKNYSIIGVIKSLDTLKVAGD